MYCFRPFFSRRMATLLHFPALGADGHAYTVSAYTSECGDPPPESSIELRARGLPLRWLAPGEYECVNSGLRFTAIGKVSI